MDLTNVTTADVAIVISCLALLVSAWNAWNAWRRDLSRFKFKVVYPPSYKSDDIVVRVTYRGGPAVKVATARARVVKIRGLRWFEKKPETGVDALLRPENREVPVLLDATYSEHFWYIDVFTDGGAQRRKYLRLVPKFWLKEVELGLMTIGDVGGVAIPGKFEESVRNLRKAIEMEARDQRKK